MSVRKPRPEGYSLLELRVPFDPSLIGTADLEDKSREATLRRAIKGIHHLEKLYGETYRAINDALRWAREDAPNAPDEEMAEAIDDVRRQFVLGHKAAIRRLETTINEIVPGSFPIGDEPVASGDVPCTAMFTGAGIMGAFCAAGNLFACGASGFLLGYAGAAEADGACA